MKTFLFTVKLANRSIEQRMKVVVVARNTCNPVPFIAVESKVSTLH